MRLVTLMLLAACGPGLTPSGDDTARNDDTGLPDDTSDSEDTGRPSDSGDSGESGDSGDSGDTGNPGACPAQTTCVSSFPYVDDNTTTGGRDDFDTYSCAPNTGDEAGPERVYRLDLSESGFLTASIGSPPPQVDVDLHLLRSLDPDDCITRGHFLSGAYVEAGTYWLVVDTWTNGTTEFDGAYDLTVGFTTESLLEDEGMASKTAERALTAFDHAWAQKDTDCWYYTVIDYEPSSADERLWLLDFTDGSVVDRLHVAHGSGSDANDDGLATTFSNTSASNQSSLGMMQAAETYTGTYGYSMRLDGLETGINDNVRDRTIIFAGASWATASYATSNGKLGLSGGSVVVGNDVSTGTIDTIKDGCLLWFHYPDQTFLSGSDYL